jgi:malonate-semialdehyde dehydrogenase (acetylating)/methylmalonate-semialdehyde dehydrogenase
VAKLKVADGMEPDADMGPLVTAQHRAKVAGYVESGIRSGANLVIDGRDLKVAGREDGFFLGPCMFDEVTPEMEIYRDEIFGPVLVMVRAGSYREAIDRHIYGPEGVDFYTRGKVITARWPEPKDAGVNLGFPTAT